MLYDLPPTGEPNFAMLMEARFATPLQQGAFYAQRLMEISSNINAKLGVLCRGDVHSYGIIDISAPLLRSPAKLEDFDFRLKLQEQKVILNEFRRIFGGSLRAGMTAVSNAHEGRSVYFVFYDLGAIAIVPSPVGPDRWRLALLRATGARTMEEERTCVAVNRSSRDLYEILWESLNELAMKEIDEDPTLAEDALDATARQRPSYDGSGDRATLQDEEDALEEAGDDIEGLSDAHYDVPLDEPDDYRPSGDEDADSFHF